MQAIEKHGGKSNLSTLYLLLFICAMTVLTCLLLYQYDNKYTYEGPQAVDGVLTLDKETLQAHPVIMLVDGWEYYPGQLLHPRDFVSEEGLFGEYIYIGYYAGFEGASLDSPHGSATYRLSVSIPMESDYYTLELPEIFSSYVLYINGRQMMQLGNPDPSAYKAETLNTSVCFEAGDSIEIVIAVSDFSHYYSGLVYPPAFGKAEDVSKLLSGRFLFRAVLCTAALTVGILSVLVGLISSRSSMTILYGLLCIFFVGYIGYPVAKTFFKSYFLFYAVENISYCAMLLVVMQIQRRLYEFKSRWSLLFLLYGMFMCAFCGIMHLRLPEGDLGSIYAYSYFISAYQWIAAAYFTGSTVYYVLKDGLNVQPIMIGIVVFDTALVMDRVLPLYEPVATGWFIELASFALVLSIGAVIAKAVAQQFAQNHILEERTQSMSRLLQMQQIYYPILQEKITQVKSAKHDLRHHLLVISAFVEKGNLDGLKQYLSQYKKIPLDSDPISYCQNETADILAHYYMHVASQHEIRLTMRMDIEERSKVSDVDLCTLMSNLLENAVEACLQTEKNRFIFFTVKARSTIMAIEMENSCSDAIRVPTGFLSRKEAGRTGYGLASIRTVAEQYNGTVDFQYDKEKNTFSSYVILET